MNNMECVNCKAKLNLSVYYCTELAVVWMSSTDFVYMCEVTE